MSDLIGYRNNQAGQIANREIVAENLRKTLQLLKKKEKELLLAKQTDSSNVTVLQQEYDSLNSQITTLRADLSTASSNVESTADTFWGEPGSDFESVINQLESAYPALFFPVRLETKFLPVTTPTHLHVRIFPEPLEIQTFEHELTLLEFTAGEVYWNSVWIDENDNIPTNEEKVSAWDTLYIPVILCHSKHK